MTGTQASNPQTERFAEVLPGIWRWNDGVSVDRVGTAVASPDGWILIDPPEMPDELVAVATRDASVNAILLTDPRLAPLASGWRARGALTWAAGDPAHVPHGVDRVFTPGHPGDLPGGIRVGVLPAPEHLSAGIFADGNGHDQPLGASSGSHGLALEAETWNQVAYCWTVQLPKAADGTGGVAWIAVTGDALSVAGQTPYFDEPPAGSRFATEGRTIEWHQAVLRALQALAPDVLLPGRHGPFDEAVARSTGYAGHIGRPSHVRRAPPVVGPRFGIGQAGRVLADTVASPVIRRLPVEVASLEGVFDPLAWVAEPWACTSCGTRTEPLPATCGGPPIPRLCPDCRVATRAELPEVRMMVCGGGCCTREGARALVSALRREVVANRIDRSVAIVPVSCIGECSIGPFLRVADARGAEVPVAARLRATLTETARDLAAETGEVIDAASDAVLDKWIPMVRPQDGASLVRELAPALREAVG